MHSAADQARVVDFEVVARAGHCHLSTLQGRVRAVDLARARLAGHHVVRQDAIQQVRVSLELVDGGRRELVECGIRGRKKPCTRHC